MSTARATERNELFWDWFHGPASRQCRTIQARRPEHGCPPSTAATWRSQPQASAQVGWAVIDLPIDLPVIHKGGGRTAESRATRVAVSAADGGDARPPGLLISWVIFRRRTPIPLGFDWTLGASARRRFSLYHQLPRGRGSRPGRHRRHVGTPAAAGHHSAWSCRGRTRGSLRSGNPSQVSALCVEMTLLRIGLVPPHTAVVQLGGLRSSMHPLNGSESGIVR